MTRKNLAYSFQFALTAQLFSTNTIWDTETVVKKLYGDERINVIYLFFFN